jgi:fibronectin-binding autotransporter adhesin
MSWWMRSGLVAAVMATACNGDDDKSTPDGSSHTGDTDPTPTDDADGDGAADDIDCDDEDATVRPGVEERCDGIDTDCDPLTDDPVGKVGRSDGGNTTTITQAVAESSDGGTIWICAGTYVESVTVDKALTILGLGAVTIDADGIGPAFDVVGGAVSISDVHIVNGAGSPNGPTPENGGGINAYEATGPLTLTRVVIEDSLAELAGAVLLGDAGGTIDACTFERNVAGTHGGALFVTATATVTGTTIRNNTANGYGGGITFGNAASAVVTDSVVEGNDANIGGGVFTFERGLVDLTGTVVRNNTASNGGGGVYVWDSDFTGGEVSENDGNGQGGGVFVYEGGSLTDVHVTGNQAIDGAGMWLQGDVALTGVIVDANTALDSAGGAYLLEATVTATDTAFEGNEGAVRGGGLLMVDSTLTGGDISGNAAVDGGGVFISGAGMGASHLVSVAVADNTAVTSGAGVYAETDWSFEDVDLSRNVSGERGGGLYTTFGASGTMADGTVFGNAAAERGGGLYPNAASTILIQRTLITFNVALRGAGMYINDGSTVTVIDAAVESNGDATTVSGGGARVTGGTLISTNSDWGTGPTDNVPDDVFVEVGQAGYIGYGDDETFTCDENACVPLP